MANDHTLAGVVDETLLALEQEIRSETIEASHVAGVWIGTGMEIAASIVERKRIELICAGILDDVGEDQGTV